MDNASQPLSAEALLAQADWVRALARTLVRDPGAAEDVAQAAWLAALASPPRNASNLRAWFSRVVRHAAGQRARSEDRRRVRERAVARAEALPDSSELVAQAELQRELVGHVLALAEPYRTTILLRYFEGLEAREIAAQQGLPLATVRTRLQRALAQVRERLDRERGGRANWQPALALLIPRRASFAALPTSVALGGAFVAMAWKIGVAALVVAAGWWAWTSAAPEEASPSRALGLHVEDTSLIASASDARHLDGVPDVALDAERTLLPDIPASEPSEAPPAAAVQTRHVTGRIVDVRGRPIGGLRIRAFARNSLEAGGAELPDSRVHGTTGADGRYELEVPGWFFELESADEDWLLVCEGLPLGGTESIRVAVPCRAIEGVVVDEAGAPLADAKLEFAFDCTALAEFPHVLYGAERTTWSALSEQDGRFRIAAMPAGVEVEVAREGYETTRVRELEPHARIALRAAQPPAARQIRGLVLDARSSPVVGAALRFGSSSTVSDDLGRFELPVLDFEPETPLIAVAAGYEAVSLEGFGRRLSQRGERVDEVVLRIEAAALAIRGRVLDADGRPCTSWWIDLADGTPSGTPALSVEREAAGRRDGPLTTDEDGRFLLNGLSDRSYRVRAHDATRCLFVLSEPTRAGTDELVLRVPRDAILPVLRGRVLSRRGRPVGHAVVRLAYTVQVLPSGAALIANCREVQADEHGRFEFADVAREHVVLHVAGPQIESTELFEIPAEGELELRASVRCRFRVDLAPHDPADRLRVLDEQGLELDVSAPTSSAIATDGSVLRGAEGFPVCVVADQAATLILYRGEQELRRVPLDLTPNELQVISL